MKKFTLYFLISLLGFSLVVLEQTQAKSSSGNSGLYGGSKYYGKQLCNYSEFSCITVKNGDSWAKLWPNPQQRALVQRLNRSNVSIYSRPWVVVPKNLANLTSMQLSPLALQRDTNGSRLVIVNMRLQAFGAYNEQGRLVYWGPVSGGKGYCPDVKRPCLTPLGSFKIQRKGGASCISNKYPIETNGGAKTPYCMFFHGGYALHGSYTLPGYNDSHGCVRLYVDDARWLNQNFTQIGTRVIVTNQ